MKHISLFSGIGGFDLAAEWMGWENIAHCEWNETGRRVLHYYWPKADTHEDITRSDFTIYRGFDGIITGGFPCQPFSLAGTRKGTADGRYLWPEMLRAIRECQPAAIIAENVAGLLTMGEYEMFAQVDSRNLVRYQDSDHYEAIYTRQEKMLLNNICEDLEQAGYQVQPVIIPASAVNAPHRRDRIWIIGIKNATDTDSAPPQRRNREAKKERTGQIGRIEPPGKYLEWQKFPTESPICGGNDGLPTELDGITFSKWRQESIKAYGNAIVPQVAYQIMQAIEAVLTNNVP